MIVNLFNKAYASLVKWIWRNRTKNYDEGDVKAVSISSMYGSKSANSSSSSRQARLDDYNMGMNFTIFNAHGGKVVQINTYDQKTERTNTDLYLIVDSDDFGEQLAMIVTRTNLTR